MNAGNSWLSNLKGDKGIWSVIILLAMVSMITVYSATASMAFRHADGGSEMYLVKHGLMISLSLLVTWLLSNLHYKQLFRIAPLALVVTIALLAYTLFFGVNVNEARRWIELPFVGITFQTSDIAKLVLILYVARVIALRQDSMKTSRVLIPLLVPVGIVVLLIAPANLSTALLLFATSFVMMFVGRIGFKHMFMMLLIGVGSGALLYFLGTMFPEWVRLDTWISRIQEFWYDSEGEYQVKQAKIAIAEGGFANLAPGSSGQRNYLPYAYADFIYAIICEEYGMLGGAFIITLYTWLFYRCVVLMTRSKKVFGAILAVGLGLSLVIQAFANIAVSVHLVPVTGLTLPFISMGGTSLLFTSAAFGIILSVSRTVEAARRAERENRENYVASPGY